jgi:CHAD domain-containing protein
MPQPVVTFLHYSATLKAAMEECAEKPKPKAVHQLRSSTRRMEAVLELLATSADQSGSRKEEKSFRKYLRKIRRAAGKVRDLDVHLELLAAYKNFPDAAILQRDLDAVRKRSGKKLQRRLLKDEREIERAMNGLEAALAPSADLNLSGGNLAQAAQDWLMAAIDGLSPQEDDDLHSIRKACKTARYIAEIGTETSQAAAKLANRFEDIQQATGAWHDCLLLLNEAHASLPENSPLIEKIQAKALQLRHKAESKAKSLHSSTKPPHRSRAV